MTHRFCTLSPSSPHLTSPLRFLSARPFSQSRATAPVHPCALDGDPGGHHSVVGYLTDLSHSLPLPFLFSSSGNSWDFIRPSVARGAQHGVVRVPAAWCVVCLPWLG
jgi:hypothetical protein